MHWQDLTKYLKPFEVLITNHTKYETSHITAPCLSPFGFWLKQTMIERQLHNQQVNALLGYNYDFCLRAKSRMRVFTPAHARGIAGILRLSESHVIDLAEQSNDLYSLIYPQHQDNWVKYQRTILNRYRLPNHVRQQAAKNGGQFWNLGEVKAFETYRGPTALMMGELPLPVVIAMRNHAVKKDSTNSDVLRAAVETWLQENQIHVDWEPEI